MNKDKRVKRDPKTGTYYFVVDLAPKNGKRQQARRRGFPTLKAANDALREILDAAGAGGPVPGARGGLTVGNYLTDRWLPSLAAGDLRPTTIDSYRSITVNHLVPRLGAIVLGELDASAIDAMSGALAGAGLSAKTRSNVDNVLSRALADAVRWKLLARSPIASAKSPRTVRPVPKVWSATQLARFLEHVEGDRLEPLWRFLVVTGCRRGEACGLRWSDVDLDSAAVTIVNQRTLANGRIVEGDVKTVSGARTVALDHDTVTALRSWRRVQRAEIMRLGIRSGVAYGRRKSPAGFGTCATLPACRASARTDCGTARRRG